MAQGWKERPTCSRYSSGTSLCDTPPIRRGRAAERACARTVPPSRATGARATTLLPAAACRLRLALASWRAGRSICGAREVCWSSPARAAARLPCQADRRMRRCFIGARAAPAAARLAARAASSLGCSPSAIFASLLRALFDAASVFSAPSAPRLLFCSAVISCGVPLSLCFAARSRALLQRRPLFGGEAFERLLEGSASRFPASGSRLCRTLRIALASSENFSTPEVDGRFGRGRTALAVVGLGRLAIEPLHLRFSAFANLRRTGITRRLRRVGQRLAAVFASLRVLIVRRARDLLSSFGVSCSAIACRAGVEYPPSSIARAPPRTLAVLPLRPARAAHARWRRTDR